MSFPLFNPLMLKATESSSGYQIARSLRFNPADTPYLTRTFGSTGSTTKFSFSLWVKRTAFGSAQALISYNAVDLIRFNSSDQLEVQFNATVGGQIVTTRLFRDPTAWQFVLVAIDTTQATAANRVRIYINGVEETAFATASYPALNYTMLGFNNALAASIGRSGVGSYFDGYMAVVAGVDGTQCTPSNFSQTNATTGVIGPKTPSGFSYGTDGWIITFSDNSNTTAATLGADTSGNSNNWTPNSFSVVAGAGNDSLTDTPTNYGTSTGTGGEVRGNFCTFNPVNFGAGVSLANGALDAACTVLGTGSAPGTIAIGLNDKSYFELTNNATNSSAAAGIFAVNTGVDTFPGGNANGYGYAAFNGNVYFNGSGAAYGSTWATAGKIIGVAFDGPNGALYFSVDGVWQNSATSAEIAAGVTTHAAFTGITGNFYPTAGDLDTGSAMSMTANFGQRPFNSTAPAGFKAICTQNLSTPSLVKSTTAYQTNLRTGTGTSASVTGMPFPPDLVWIKDRSATNDHQLYDTSRGATQVLSSNNTAAESTVAQGLMVFNSDGYTLGTSAAINTNADTFVDWCWRKGAAYGFDIVLYTGTGAAHTVAHSLGAAPGMFWCKARSSNPGSPLLYHSALGGTKYLIPNSTAAAATNISAWNNTAPTSSVFTVGTDAGVNSNTVTYVAWLWASVAGFSSFGSYTGNGNADGPYVNCGFRPAYVMIKDATSGLGDPWYILDNARNTYNVETNKLFPNGANAENSNGAESTSTNLVDFTANGFKLRTSNSGTNNSAATVIYAAFAESPFKYARGR